MPVFEDFYGRSALEHLTDEQVAHVDVIVQFMAPRRLSDVELSRWPRVWARQDQQTWIALELTGQARQLAGLLAVHPGGLRATEAAKLINADDTSIDSIARSAKNYLHKGFGAAGLGDYFPERKRQRWQLSRPTSDVALALSALDGGHPDAAVQLSDEGCGYLILFPQAGLPDTVSRRQELRGMPDLNPQGVRLPPQILRTARDIELLVRSYLNTRQVNASHSETDGAPPERLPATPGEDRNLPAEVPIIEVDAEPVLEDDDATQPPDHVRDVVALLPRAEPTDSHPRLALVPLSIIRELPAERTGRQGKRWTLVAAAVVPTIGIGLLVGLPPGRDANRTSVPRYAKTPVPVTILNVVTDGQQNLREDKAPLRLSTRPVPFCSRRGCLIRGTERYIGDTYDGAVCQTIGERTTNGNDQTTSDDRNPQLRTSNRYLGIRLPDGTFGYSSVVWLSPAAQRIRDLPSCDR